LTGVVLGGCGSDHLDLAVAAPTSDSGLAEHRALSSLALPMAVCVLPTATTEFSIELVQLMLGTVSESGSAGPRSSRRYVGGLLMRFATD
jgi:hypothetical protein